MDLEKNNSSGLVGVAVSLLVLTHLCVLLRSYARAMLTKNFQMDDWLMIVSQVRAPSCRMFIQARADVCL